MEIVLNNQEYELDRNVKEAFVIEEVRECFTDYFEAFDYILGDYAYGKLRLKGFNEKGNKNFKNYNNIAKVDEYIAKQCAYGCRYFLLKKVQKTENSTKFATSK